MVKVLFFSAICLTFAFNATLYAQDDLIKKKSGNKTEGKAGLPLPELLILNLLPIEDQGSSVPAGAILPIHFRIGDD